MLAQLHLAFQRSATAVALQPCLMLQQQPQLLQLQPLLGRQVGLHCHPCAAPL